MAFITKCACLVIINEQIIPPPLTTRKTFPDILNFVAVRSSCLKPLTDFHFRYKFFAQKPSNTSLTLLKRYAYEYIIIQFKTDSNFSIKAKYLYIPPFRILEYILIYHTGISVNVLLVVPC